MSAFRERLRSGVPLLLDGGLGTMLIARGLPAGVPPEAWVIERPNEVRAVHRAYFEAGSDAAHTATFGGNPIRLARAGLAERCEEIHERAVRLAREVAGGRLVVADVGPTGEYLPPVGTANEASFRAAFDRQARAIAAARPDAAHIETMSDLREARIALDALRAAAPGLPVMVSLTFERKKRGFFTIFGNPPAASLQALADAGADAVGANCTITSDAMRELAREVRPKVSAPLVLQPNAGSPIQDGALVRYAQTPETFAEEMAEVAHLGVEAVGGCCGTDPRFIACLRRRLGGAAARGGP